MARSCTCWWTTACSPKSCAQSSQGAAYRRWSYDRSSPRSKTCSSHASALDSRMDEQAIVDAIAARFAGLDVLRPTDGPGAGDTFFIYDPERNLDDRHRMP